MSDPSVAVEPGLIVSGQGNGHGRGMSQYGARARAVAGQSTAEILRFYYPGTTPATYAKMVRVLISADNDRNVIVHPAKGLRVTDLGTGKVYPLPVNGARGWRLSIVAGKTRVSYFNGGWRAYRPGGRVALVGDGQFRSASSTLTLRTPTGDRRYRGSMRLAAGNTVNVLSLDNYVKGVIPREMPTSWATAAVGAQAVAARTYAVREMVDNPNRSYHLCDTTRCQVYGGLADETRTGNAAVVATSRSILHFDGIPAFTQFSATNGGYSADGGKPYLRAVIDPYDLDDRAGNPYRSWTKPLDVAALRAAYPALGALETLQVIRRDGPGAAGHVALVKLTFAKGEREVSGTKIRSLLGLRSTNFTLTKQGNRR